MKKSAKSLPDRKLPALADFSLPLKALVSAVIITMALAMIGALGQIIVHDIIPTFFSDQTGEDRQIHTMQGMKSTVGDEESELVAGRGDLFSEAPSMEKSMDLAPFYKSEQFVWTLKWTHIHLFGINMIFIFIGAITVFLDASVKARTWLVILPFMGVLIDILAMWLKGYVSPQFFWLHIPGGGLFGFVFVSVSARAIWEMWWPKGKTDYE